MKGFHKRITHIQGEYVQNFERARTRLFAILLFFTFAYIIIGIRLVVLMAPQIISPSAHNASQITAETQSAPKRADIYDRNGILIATSLETPSLYADPKLVDDPERLAKDIVNVFPDLDFETIKSRLEKKNRFAWIKRHLTPKQRALVLQIGDPSLNVKNEYRRVYPHNNLFAHVLGYANIDGKGIAGLEKSYDDQLLNHGEALNLTLDVRVQDVLRSEIQKSITDFEAIGGSGIVMNVNTGEIIAMASLPDFDLHNPGDAIQENMFNRNTAGVYEMGSTFKIFSTAAALEFNSASVKDSYDVKEPLKVARFTIRDFKPKKRTLTLPEVFVHSSNIGTAKIAEKLGTEKLKAFYDDLGFFSRLKVDLPEVASPILPHPWRDINTLTASYGHGIAVSPLHVTRAVSAIVNGGTLYDPVFISGPQKKPNLSIISPQTSQIMRGLLALTVETGTGSFAKNDYVWVGGKTGTAEKISANGYLDDKLFSSFVGVFPADQPEYVVLVAIDEPKGQKKSYGYATGGWTAAPVVGKVIEYMKPLMPETQTATKRSFPAMDALRPYIHEDQKRAAY